MGNHIQIIIDSFKNPTWYAMGIIDIEKLHSLFSDIKETQDFNNEHYRWRAFKKFFKENYNKLTSEEFNQLYELGLNDQDLTMGESIVCELLKAKTCPQYLLHKAIKSNRERVKKFAQKKLQLINNSNQ